MLSTTTDFASALIDATSSPAGSFKSSATLQSQAKSVAQKAKIHPDRTIFNSSSPLVENCKQTQKKPILVGHSRKQVKRSDTTTQGGAGISLISSPTSHRSNLKFY